MVQTDFTIETLGKAKARSPMDLSLQPGDFMADFVRDDQFIIYDIETTPAGQARSYKRSELLELAGPRQFIYFEPAKTHAAIVTCGGLCPGLNDVIRAIVMCLWYRYGVKRISGIKFGYRGLLPEFNLPVKNLTPESVEGAHRQGGTMLGSSRGYGDRTTDIVDSMEKMNVNMMFVIGGDGTQKGALAISGECKSRGLKIAVIGVPKTIDNDLSFVQKSFGFETAVSVAADVVEGAHVEAHDALNGISLVQVMGRQSGFIAAHTALANNEVNFVLIPEVPLDLYGENGLLIHLEERLKRRNHAVILAAEGVHLEGMDDSIITDASGNIKYTDVGDYLKESIKTYFKEKNISINLKYINPSYIIRSAPANANDSIYCARLGTNAVHAAMAGKTAMLISLLNDCFVHVPIQMSVSRRNTINPESSLWRDVIAATGQPKLMTNPPAL
ncbi:MAG: ATP-dependent 6-phosphofructokinase [Candidatus Brocadiia bacterium]|nr:MAG: ATP-dependent 6-phosphofructokinase [Candidatus Brocadiia bacterium]